jgi:transcriptional antiterminator
MAKLTKLHKYSIAHLHNQKMEPEAIAKEVGLSLRQVKNEISKIQPKASEIIGESKTDKTKNLMIRQTSGKKINSVSIMTEAAAQLSDEFIKTIPAHNKSQDSYIFRPRGN